MFGIGGTKRRVRNETFAPSRLRGAALAGLGMLAWKWWRNRQATNQPTAHQDRTFSEPSTRPGGSF
jgi:uncharacterized membrane protein YebE (DUF533 family)